MEEKERDARGRGGLVEVVKHKNNVSGEQDLDVDGLRLE